MPLSLLPPRLYISVPYGAAAAGLATYVSTQQSTVANYVVAIANGGGVGGNASGATAGTAGAGGSAATAATMPIGWPFAVVIGGMNGQAGSSLNTQTSLPTSGIRVTGGPGGASLGASGAAGVVGGSFFLPAAPTPFLAHPGGAGGSTATTPPGNGTNGFTLTTDLGAYYYAGTGGGATHGSATGAGLVQAAGGNGGIGSGGGGMGGALTGSTAATVSRGGSGLVIITCY